MQILSKAEETRIPGRLSGTNNSRQEALGRTRHDHIPLVIPPQYLTPQALTTCCIPHRVTKIRNARMSRRIWGSSFLKKGKAFPSDPPSPISLIPVCYPYLLETGSSTTHSLIPPITPKSATMTALGRDPSVPKHEAWLCLKVNWGYHTPHAPLSARRSLTGGYGELGLERDGTGRSDGAGWDGSPSWFDPVGVDDY